jgi:hypothetical protein
MSKARTGAKAVPNRRYVGLLLIACATPEALVRSAASRDFACPEDTVAVETRSERHHGVDGGEGDESVREVYVARGCGTSVVYAVGGEWLSTWAAPCAPVTVRGQRLRIHGFANIPPDFCADTIADAGALGPE